MLFVYADFVYINEFRTLYDAACEPKFRLYNFGHATVSAYEGFNDGKFFKTIFTILLYGIRLGMNINYKTESTSNL